MIAKQNIKLFPPDFFNDKTKTETRKDFKPKEIKVKSDSFKVKEENLFKQTAEFGLNDNKKQEGNKHFYFEFHEEDKELLDMLKVQKTRESMLSINKFT